MKDDMRAKAHHAAANAAARLRTEPESAPRADELERWRREKDRPEREAKSDTAAALISYVRACGYSPEVEPVLIRVLAATYGADRLVRCPDWLMGLYLGGDSEDKAEAIRKLPAHSTEKRTLARRWRRAWDVLQKEQERTGIFSVVRKHGDFDRESNTGRRSSELHALFAQDIVEIVRRAKMLRTPRVDRFNEAAREHVENIRDDKARLTKGQNFAPEQRPKRVKPERDREQENAARRLRYLQRLDKWTAELIEEEEARGASPDDLEALREMAHSHLEQRFVECITAQEEKEKESDPVHLCSLKERATESPEVAERVCVCATLRTKQVAAWDCPACGPQAYEWALTSPPPAQDAKSENSQENHEPAQILVDSSVYQNEDERPRTAPNYFSPVEQDAPDARPELQGADFERLDQRTEEIAAERGISLREAAQIALQELRE